MSSPGQTPLRFDTSYTARGQPATVRRYADLLGLVQAGETDYSYDPAGRLSNQQDKNGSGAVFANATYGYDLASRVTAVTLNGSTTSYGYDSTNQVTNDSTVTYSYDLAGNRTMSGYQTGAGNEVTTDGVWTYTYDTEGNLQKKSKGANAETWVYSYDQNNQMVSAQDRQTDGGTLIQQATFQYDVFGQRVEEDAAVNGVTTVSRYGYDQGNVWADASGSGTLQARRLYGDGGSAPVARVVSVGQPNAGVGWYTTDRLGSVRNLTDGSGNVQATLSYDGFGNVLTNSNPSFVDRYGYAGAQTDSVTGYQYDLHRWYDPHTGRWTSQDPLGFAAGDANLYRYVGNDATNATDPKGLWGVDTTVADLQARHPDVYNYFIGAHNGHFIATDPGLFSLFSSGEDLQADANGNKTAQGQPVLWASIPNGYSDRQAADAIAGLVQQKWGRDFLRWKAIQAETALYGDQAVIPQRDARHPLADWDLLMRQRDRDFAKAAVAQREADRAEAQALVEARQAAGAPAADPMKQFIDRLQQDQVGEQGRLEQLAGAYQQAQHLHALHSTPEMQVADFLQSLAMPFTSQSMGLPGSDPWVTAETIVAYRQQGTYHPLLNPTCDQEALRQWAYDNRWRLLTDAVFSGMDLLGGIGALEGLGALLERGLARAPAAALETGVAPQTARVTQGPVSLTVLDSEFVLDTRAALQRLTDQAVKDLERNPGLARQYLSDSAYQRLRSGSLSGRANFGNAVEARVRDLLGQDPLLSQVVEHTGQTQGAGGRWVTSPDFVSNEAGLTRQFDITTPGQMGKKLRFGPFPHLDFRRCV